MSRGRNDARSAPPPLAGITVVDLSRVLAGPFCTMILAARRTRDQGGGAGRRRRLPHFGPFANGKSLYFSSLNYDKQSIALDLKQPADRETFEGLLGMADVVDELRPGTMERLRLQLGDVTRCRDLHLRHNFGVRRQRAVLDAGRLRHGGARHGRDHEPDRPAGLPADAGGRLDRRSGSGFVSYGRLTRGIYKRSQGGGAVKVDVAMLDCQVALLENALARYLRLGEVARPQGSRHPEIAPFQVYATSDGFVVIAAGNDRLFERLARASAGPTYSTAPTTRPTPSAGRTSTASKRTWTPLRGLIWNPPPIPGPTAFPKLSQRISPPPSQFLGTQPALTPIFAIRNRHWDCLRDPHRFCLQRLPF